MLLACPRRRGFQDTLHISVSHSSTMTTNIHVAGGPAMNGCPNRTLTPTDYGWSMSRHKNLGEAERSLTGHLTLADYECRYFALVSDEQKVDVLIKCQESKSNQGPEYIHIYITRRSATRG